MPLQKLQLKPGVNKENTRYTNEGGWYDSEKVRFRQGTPEKIGGWQQISSYTYEGNCRSLWSWASLSGITYIGVGTYLKFYIALAGRYNDVTPIRAYENGLSGPFIAYIPRTFTVTIAQPAVLTFSAAMIDGAAVVLSTTGTLPTGLVAGQTYYVVGSAGTTCKLSLTYGGQAINTSGSQYGTHSLTCNTLKVTDAGHGAATGDYVNFLGATSLSNQTFTRATTTQFTLTTAIPANSPVIVSVSTGGSLPTGLVAGVVYYVNVISGTTVTFALSVNGAPVVTSSAGSGTFYLYVNEGMTADVLNSSFRVTVTGVNTYLIYAPTSAGSYDIGTGGTVNAAYQIPIGADISQPLTGWGAGSWGGASWGTGQAGTSVVRIWYQANFGQDLVFGYRGGPLYYWTALVGVVTSRVSINISTSTFTLVSGSLTTGIAVVLQSTGLLPTGLTVGTIYFATVISGSTFKLATTFANAVAITPTTISLSGTQSGTHSLAPNGLLVSSLGGASNAPDKVNYMMVSDASRFTIAFGCTPYGGGDLDPMLIRWSDQESVVNWTPSATNQAGFVRLSHGSKILTAVQTRQEIVVFTDTSLYSLQYLGPPYIWGSQLLADNTSIAGYNTATVASGVMYWMGVDKFYRYDGRVQTLRCDLRQFIYGDINLEQQAQFFASTNEGFNEVWWFYCTSGSTVIDRYVVYNYAEDIWYYGSMGRTAWLDSGLYNYPIAATYANNLVYHEYGVDDGTLLPATAIEAYITSSQYDIQDGHNFGFVWRIIPDLTFRGSSTTGETPQVTMYLLPLQNSGSGYNNPDEAANQSVGGVSYANVDRIGTYTVDQFTGQIYTRVRGRQMALKITSNRIGTAWQLGSPRIDIRPDGRR